MNEPPRLSYDPSVLRPKRRAELDALAEAFKALLGFGQCRIVRVSDAAMDAARQYQQMRGRA